MTEGHLEEIFGYYGKVVNIDLEKNERSKLPKGSAYVSFRSADDMNQAVVHLDGGQIDGQIIKATFVLVSNRRRRDSPGNTIVLF